MIYTSPPPSKAFVRSSQIIFNDSMAAANTFQNLDISAYVGARYAKCFLEMFSSVGVGNYACKPRYFGSGTFSDHIQSAAGKGAGACCIDFNVMKYGYLVCTTNSQGIIEHGNSNNTDIITVKMIGFITE